MRLTTSPAEPRALTPGIPADLERVVLRSMARDPQDRFPSAGAMSSALERHSSGAPITTRVDHSPTRPPSSYRDPMFRSWMLVPLIVLALAAVAVIGGLALGRLELGGPLGVKPAPDQSEPAAQGLLAVAISGAEDHDPEGDGSEHPEEAPLAVDGDVSTEWGTDHYNTEAFGGLKQGLGLWVELRGNREIRRVTVFSPLDGWTFQIRPASSPEDTASFLASTDGESTFEVRSGKAVIDVEPVKAKGLLIWITGLASDDGRWAAAISEVKVMGGSS
jgi:hypothetical protein